CPQARAIDEDVAANGAGICDDAHRPPVLHDNVLDSDTLLDPGAILARTLCEGHCQGIGLDIAIARNERRALDPAPVDEWKPFRRLLGRKRIALHAEALGLPHGAADLAPAVAAAGQPQRPDLVPGNRLARLFFQAVED